MISEAEKAAKKCGWRTGANDDDPRPHPLFTSVWPDWNRVGHLIRWTCRVFPFFPKGTKIERDTIGVEKKCRKVLSTAECERRVISRP